MVNCKLVILAWNIPPSLSAVSTVVWNLASEFRKGEIVLAGDAPPTSANPEYTIEEPETVYLRKPRCGRGENSLRRLSAPLMAVKAYGLCKRKRCSSIMAVFPDEAYLFAGWMAARLTGARFYPYFHNTYLENRTGLLRCFAGFLQPRVFRDSKHVFVMSEGMVELYRRNYPGLANCTALLHTFREPLPSFQAPPPPGTTLKVGFCGTINDSCLEAAQRLFRAVSKVPGARVQFCTRLSPSYLQKIGVWFDNSSHCTPARPELLQILSQMDFLLLPHGFTGRLAQVEYETIFPTKTIEYLISGRPILAHSPPGVFLTRFLKQHDCALVVEESSETALVDAIRRLQADAELRVRLVKNALRTARMFQASVVAKHLREVLAQGETRDQRP